MSTYPLFYKKPVPLSKKDHSGLYVRPLNDFSFARGTNSVYIAAVEFFKAFRDYAIVFGKGEEGEIFPVALLGMQKDENQYIGEKGEWLVEYIPAYIRRYPFILATGQEVGSYAVCIDESHPGFNSKKEGEPLYDEKGEKTPTLERAMDFLKDYQGHIQSTTTFCKALDETGILEPMEARAEKDGQTRSITGFLCVNRELLKGLPPKKMQEFMINDYLELVYAHLFSLANLNRLIK